MKLLLDAHAFLWFGMDDKRLSQVAKSVLENFGNEKFLSIAIAWEMAIKASLGKLTLRTSIDQLFARAAEKDQWTLQPVQLSDLAVLERLPFHHKDPFDRLLVAQSIAQGMSIVSADSELDAYGIERLW